MSKASKKPVSQKLSVQALQDIEGIDPVKFGFDREDFNKPVEAYKPLNVHVFLSTTLRNTEWDSMCKNVSGYERVNKHLNTLKEEKHPAFFNVKGGDDTNPFRFTIIHGGVDFGNDQLIVATANSTGDGARMVQFPVSELDKEAAPWRSDYSSENVKPVDTKGKNFVFICCHTARDKRCGLCGVQIRDLIESEIAQEESACVEPEGEDEEEKPAATTKNAVRVYSCSHVGGHVNAANFLALNEKSAGICLGCVTPGDAAGLAQCLMTAPLDKTVDSILGLEGIKAKVRGQMLTGVKSGKMIA